MFKTIFSRPHLLEDCRPMMVKFEKLSETTASGSSFSARSGSSSRTVLFGGGSKFVKPAGTTVFVDVSMGL